MPQAAAALSGLAKRSLVVVTGKGGVGKTTVTALLARAIAASGRRVLAVEVDPRESLHRLFEAPPSDGETIPVGERLALHHLRPRAALDRLVERRIGSRWIASRVTASPAYDQFAEGAPGLEELAVFAWVAARLAGEDGGRRPPETVVLDAPASGHAAAWFEAPGLVAAAVGGGPVADLAGDLAGRLADPDSTAVVLTTLAEEMPVTETLELAERLRELHSRAPDLVVVNALLPAWPDGEVEPANATETLWLRRWRLQERETQRLAERIEAARLDLPLVARESGPALLAALLGSHGMSDDDETAMPAGAKRERAAERETRAPGPGARAPAHLPELVVAVGAGGVGKTTLAAAAAAALSARGEDTLVMTFDPSLRLRQALGLRPDEVSGECDEVDVRAPEGDSGRLTASLLDARRTFDAVVRRYAPDAAAVRRILENRLYSHLAGNLAGVLEYMAVERLYEVADRREHARIVLDTPPARQALDFLDAPRRIVAFLDSRALKLGLKPWFDTEGRLLRARRLGSVGRGFEGYLDQVVGLGLLREMSAFFQAFGPLYAGFRERAREVEALLRSPRTGFLLVTGGEPSRVPDALFFARKLGERGMRLQGVVANRIHPPSVPVATVPPRPIDGRALLAWLGERDARGVESLRRLLAGAVPLVEVPLAAEPPGDLASLADLGESVLGSLDGSPSRAQ